MPPSIPGIFALGLWIFQISLAVHVIRTGRPYWWCLVLWFLPVLGGILYLAVEVLPGMRVGMPQGDWRPRSWRIRQLEKDLEETDTVKCRLELSAELLASGQAGQASEIADGCLKGIFKDDPPALVAVARYRIEAGRIAEAVEALDRANIQADRMLEAKASVARGRCLVLLGRHGEAQPLLEKTQGILIGEEARYFLALSLEQSGKIGEARAIFEDICKRFSKSGRGWRLSEARWYKLSKERLKSGRVA